jgi:membrane protein implicated in regulation of membrane protease activity
MSMTVIWLIAAAFFALVEAATTQLVSIWFSLGSVAGMVAAALHAPVLLQLILFCGISLLVLGITRPFAKKYLTPRKTATNADRVIGMTGLVVQTIDPLHRAGQVSVGGNIWTAQTDGAPIPEGAQVTVLRIEGVKLFVVPAEQAPPQSLSDKAGVS